MGIHVKIDIEATEPDDMSTALEQLAAADSDFDFSSMQRQWHRRGALSPKQAALVIWRLQVHGVEHNPATVGLRISTRDKDREQFAAMESWQRERLIPYLSPEQRTKFI